MKLGIVVPIVELGLYEPFAGQIVHLELIFFNFLKYSILIWRLYWGRFLVFKDIRFLKWSFKKRVYVREREARKKYIWRFDDRYIRRYSIECTLNDSSMIRDIELKEPARIYI